MIKMDFCAQRAHAFEVLVNGALTDGAAAGQRNARLPQTGEQWSQNEYGCAHSAHAVFILRILWRIGCDDQRVVLPLEAAAAGSEQCAERLYIAEFWQMIDAHVFAGEQRAAHDGQHGVF